MKPHVWQFRTLVIIPVLARLKMWSEEAELLLLGTALHESGGLKYISQVGGGPALGFYQMEPRTLADLYKNGLGKAETLDAFMVDSLTREHNLTANAAYATAACRLQYRRFSEPLPGADDIEGLANYWKKYWNTERGAGTPQQFIDALKEGW